MPLSRKRSVHNQATDAVVQLQVLATEFRSTLASLDNKKQFSPKAFLAWADARGGQAVLDAAYAEIVGINKRVVLSDMLDVPRMLDILRGDEGYLLMVDSAPAVGEDSLPQDISDAKGQMSGPVDVPDSTAGMPDLFFPYPSGTQRVSIDTPDGSYEIGVGDPLVVAGIFNDMQTHKQTVVIYCDSPSQ